VCKGSCEAYGLVVVSVLKMATVWTGGIFRSGSGVVRQS